MGVTDAGYHQATLEHAAAIDHEPLSSLRYVIWGPIAQRDCLSTFHAVYLPHLELYRVSWKNFRSPHGARVGRGQKLFWVDSCSSASKEASGRASIL